MSKIAIIGVLLLVLALGLALTQLYVYNNQLANSAQFVESFPQNIPAITSLMGRTRAKLFILTDYCAYGHFSNPKAYEGYRNKLLSLANNKAFRIEMHLYDPATEDKQTSAQFGLDNSDAAATVYTHLQARSAFTDYFAYKKDHNIFGGSTEPPANYQAFLQLLHNEQAACVMQMQDAGIVVHQDVGAPLPIFLWLRDDSQEAIFSMYNLGTDSREISQRTQNPTLIYLLKDISSKSFKVNQ